MYIYISDSIFEEWFLGTEEAGGVEPGGLGVRPPKIDVRGAFGHLKDLVYVYIYIYNE